MGGKAESIGRKKGSVGGKGRIVEENGEGFER